MRSARSRDDDLTTRARIRDAAVARFATDGFGASVRTVAGDAGVSAALVIHHFGSKDALRAECDAHVLAQVREAKLATIDRAAGGTSFLEAFASADAYAPLVGYVLRSLQEGGTVGQAFVEHLLADAEAYTAQAVASGLAVPSRDERARVRYLTLSSLGALLLSVTLNPPQDPGDLTAYVRRFFSESYLPILELYTEGFLTTRRMLDDYLEFVPDPPGALPDQTA
ncbi:TetR/AcrR family transcriptional regulator [Xylanimonas ulmi]|uniref:TetR family transcriptional regulator n=1 Tax=Xylanimonas ulmi TaxID=228973 RepID=A0A4Q7M4U0_9MICO|nr:TetR family transcriptional regulator [Xylanibacterium ulmi]RZS61019.1 TetR family transcriptional regulator [Xylanibacterium ulmi]